MQSRETSLLAAAFLMLAASAFGQSARTGSITGRVFNPANNEYVRDAQIRIPRTGETTITGEGGFYFFGALSAGEVTLELNYVGHPAVTATATVATGDTATVDFNLPAPDGQPAASGTATAGEVVQLERFTVTSEAVGQAKAVMQQRATMDITQVVSADTFGDDPTGNAGDFLRNVAGVNLMHAGSEVRQVRIGGLDPNYTNITVDGVSLSVANAENTDRAPTFELVSLGSIESLDISRTVSADVDANAPAGTINLRTKSAFDRRGTHFTARAVLSMHSTAMSFHKSPGPDDDRGVLKARPGFTAEFFTAVRNKFGLIANISQTESWSETYLVEVNYDRNANSIDPRPQLPSTILFQQRPTLNRRFSASVRTDWRLTPRLWVGADVLFNRASLWIKQRSITFNTAATRSTTSPNTNSLLLLGDHPETAFEATGASYVDLATPTTVKSSDYFKPGARFEYKARDLVIDGNIAYGDSESTYDSLSERGAAYRFGTLRASNVHFQAVRSNGSDATDYKITQTGVSSGDAGLTSGAAFNKPVLYPRDDRGATAKALNFQLNASLMTRWLWPIHWKAGLKSRSEKRTFSQDYRTDRWTYDGAANWAGFKSPYNFAYGTLGSELILPGGGTLFFPDNIAIGRYFIEHQEAFTNSWDYADYYQAKVEYNTNYRERVDAGYFMGTTTFWDSRLQARAGVRWEGSMQEVREFDPLSTQELKDAGYTGGFSGSGIATTKEGIDQQFFSKPLVARTREYDNLFPSASFKWRIRQGLALQLGMSTTIRRPTFGDYMGRKLYNDTARTITIPNIKLNPERSRNFAARLIWYFKGASNLSAAVYQNHVKNKIQDDKSPVADYDAALAEEYPGYEVVSRFNSGGTVQVRSLELGWRQDMSSVSPLLQGLSLRANYTRTYADILVTGLIPHAVNAGFNYTYKKLNLYANYNWNDEYPLTASGLTWRLARCQTDLGGSWRFNRRYAILVSVRNALNDKYLAEQRVPGCTPVLSQCEEVGAFINFSIKGEW